MRSLLFALILFSSVYSDSGIPERCSSSVNCKSCHAHIVKDWESSWHAKSHYEKNEYYQKSVDYLAKKSYQSTSRVMVKCAKCHNPRIGIHHVSEEESYAHALGINNENSQLSKAVKAEVLKEGINCIVCHKIASIAPAENGDDQGNAVLTWLDPGIIGGPYNDAKSNFHQSKQQSFFNNPDHLCLVCHSSMQSINGLELANTGKEFKSSQSNKSCVECHMSEKKEGYAALVPNTEGVKVKRMVRRHKFAGAHYKNILKNALDLEIRVDDKSVKAVLHNPNPHAIPTGFGGREIIVEAHFYNADKVIKKQKSLTTYYQSKRSHKTIPHFSARQSKNRSVPALGKKSVTFARINGADRVEVFVWYRLVNDEIRTLLDLKQKRWSNLELITSGRKKIE